MVYYKIDEKDPIMEEMNRLIGDDGPVRTKQYYTFGAFLYVPQYHEVCVVAEDAEEAREKAQIDIGNNWWSFQRDPAGIDSDAAFAKWELEDVGNERPHREGGIVRGVRVESKE